ncbi:MAG: serine protease [Deltaproteobacteria bacterium RBG_19FT_COMBO_46_12]|nr:MAG: serine protease [Deltaproteobacteria bacterium RBG_19FT_COMBO_46_12]
MKKYKVLIFLSIFFLFPLVFVILGGTQEKAPIFTIEVDGIINPATAKFIIESIDIASQQGAQCLIIQLDTPGGLMESMRIIVKKILSANIPIIVYVAPSGARAASAGVFITMSAHIAVMAPSTHIGAAHPVSLGEGKESKTMSEKIVNDTVSYIKTTAKARGRNVDWAEQAVRKSVSITEEEAVKLNVVDFISPNLQDLLNKIDGKILKFDGVTRTLLTKGIQPRSMQMSWRYRFLDIISNPSIAYILLMLGIYGVFFELSNPGAILPGVVGGIFLILAFYALQMLPINFAGLALILFAIILFIAEIKVVSHGLLAVGGVISLFLGSLMLIESPAEYMRISLSVIIPAVLVSAAFFVFALTMAIRARLTKPTTGMEGLVGEEGIASTSISPEGKVSIHGEFWNAITDQNIERGDKVQVIGVVNLKLKVKKN